MSDFEFKSLERVKKWNKVWTKKITFWSILLPENDIICIRSSSDCFSLKCEFYDAPDFAIDYYNMSDSELNFWRLSEFEKRLRSKKHNMNHVTPRERQFFHFTRLFETQNFELKKLHCVRIGIQKLTKNEIFC